MQKIIKGLFVLLTAMMVSSCTKEDNFDGPNAAFKGRLLDNDSKENFLTETGGVQIKLEELSWSATPTPQYIPSKSDGTFEDTKLFSGHYRVTPVNGAFWPVEGIEMDINGTATQDFTLTPYLRITQFTHELQGTTLIMRFKLSAPVETGLPRILDVKPFVNTSEYVGSGATISQYTDPNKIDINSSWSADIAAKTYEIQVPNLKTTRTFYARVGVRVDDSFKQFNYSQIIEVKVP
ncbi:DUF3823 domain-containing protein [Chitinophaga filiformis]|uniref:DUF3823 domain-containing protein n=1 Tax=Chitinophaga filiformis TaxID=104663 RepID=A0A1G7LNF4_CHIFI|nr:DUF3823 domain-containing protein [Chitinophaga filiformis]SDF50943.1 Protein of unknown function [Chitinophaga filiformis]